MNRELYVPFLGALRLFQPNDRRGYLPPETILAESLKNALSKDEELRRKWGGEFYFVNDWSCRSPEVDDMVAYGFSSGIIDFPEIDWFSRPGYNFLILHRGANHFLAQGGTQKEDIRKLALATHNELLPTIEEHLKFLEGRDCQTFGN